MRGDDIVSDSSSNNLMTEGSIWKKMLIFAIPLFIGNLFQQLYNTVDSLIVGNFLGSNALAAVSSSGNLIFLMTGFFQGLAAGAGVVIATYFGAKKFKEMQDSIHTTVALGIACGIILMVVGYFLAPQMLILMGTPENTLPLSTEYFKIYFLGALGSLLYNCCVGILQAVGDSKRPLYYLIISSVVNVVLDILFIVVFKWGVGSAALATIISQYLSAILVMIRLIKSNEVYKVTIRKIRFHKEMLIKILKVGLPSGLQNSIISIANVVVQSNINSFGEFAMAGCGAYSKIEGFAFLPITSFTMAITTFVGQNLGAQKYDRVKKGAKFGIACSMILAELVGLITFVFAPQLIGAFSDDPLVISFGVDRAQTSAFFFCLLAFSHCISAVLRGAGKSSVPMLVMLLCWCLIRVTILEVGDMFYHSIQFVYWVYPITWSLSSTVFLIYYNKVNWMHE